MAAIKKQRSRYAIEKLRSVARRRALTSVDGHFYDRKDDGSVVKAPVLRVAPEAADAFDQHDLDGLTMVDNFSIQDVDTTAAEAKLDEHQPSNGPAIVEDDFAAPIDPATGKLD